MFDVIHKLHFLTFKVIIWYLLISGTNFMNFTFPRTRCSIIITKSHLNNFPLLSEQTLCHSLMWKQRIFHLPPAVIVLIQSDCPKLNCKIVVIVYQWVQSVSCHCWLGVELFRQGGFVIVSWLDEDILGSKEIKSRRPLPVNYWKGFV